MLVVPAEPARLPSFEYVPHVGELGLRLRGATLADVFREAALALAEILNPDRITTGQPAVRRVVLSASDREALLVDWLNELLFLAERERWIPVCIERLDAGETSLVAQVRGQLLEQSPALVKAATWHDLRFAAGNNGYEAEVLLDV